MPEALGTVTVKIKLIPSEEREAIAKFLEYAFEQKWESKAIIDTVRSGEYLTVMIQKESPFETYGGLG